MILYEVVNCLSSFKGFQDFYQHVIVHGTSISFTEKHITWYPPLLIFPEDELSGCCSDMEKQILYFIAGCFNMRTALGESGDIEEESIFRYYFTAGASNSDGKKKLKFYEQRRVSDTNIPVFMDNLQEFRCAIRDLLVFVNKLQTGNGDWTIRLNTVLEMLDTETDFLLVYRLAGLYDIESLWMSLTDLSLHCSNQLESVKRNYILQLHRYAMFHINALRMNEIEEDTVDSHDTTATASSLSNIQTSRPEEYKWLCYIHENTLPEHITEPTYVNDILPTDWINDIEAMQKAFDWKSDERRLLADACNDSSADYLGPRYVDVLRQLVRKRLRQEAVKEFEERKMQWMYSYNR